MTGGTEDWSAKDRSASPKASHPPEYRVCDGQLGKHIWSRKHCAVERVHIFKYTFHIHMQTPVTCDKCAVASRSYSPKRHLFHLMLGIQASTDARIQTGGGTPASMTAGRPKLKSRNHFTSFSQQCDMQGQHRHAHQQACVPGTLDPMDKNWLDRSHPQIFWDAIILQRVLLW